MRNPTERLRDILEAIAAIERHLDGDKISFEHDELRQTWFLRHLQIIGEAARALPTEVRIASPTGRPMGRAALAWPPVPTDLPTRIG